MIYRDVNIAITVLSAVINLVLLLYLLVKKRKTKLDKWFAAIIGSNMGMLIGDIAQSALGGIPGGWARAGLIIGTIIIYFSSTASLIFTIFGWVMCLASMKNVKVNKWYYYISITLVSLNLIMALTMPFTKICYIDENNIYKRGPYFYIDMICPYLLYIMLFVFTVKNIKVFKHNYLGLASIIVVPMIAQVVQVVYGEILICNVTVTVGLVAGVIFIQHRREYDKEEELRNIALKENKKLEELMDRQESLNSQLIEVLCRAVEAKDMYTRGHSMRVAQYAREIMYRMGGDEKAQQEVYCIGILHDVGKISVKDEIINKKGRLTDEEYEQIKLHTIAGYQILRGVDIIPDLAIGARWHHERYDGTGYPNGLAGENIPLIARIISVADAYDAMTSNRSYHSVMAQSDVRDQIVKGMGTQFDPEIAKIMLEMIDDDIEYDMKQVNYNRIVNILMIDDDSFMHTMVEQILSNENYMITHASSGAEGIEYLKEFKYDLCLLDKEMPEMDGIEVLRWIHKNVRKLKVILLTGDKDINTIKTSEALGAVDYITKPIKTKILKESINSVLTH